MTTCCECGEVATFFHNEAGEELPDPVCDECWYFAQEKEAELFGGIAVPQINSYPADWPDIADQIKEEAEWCCEHCGETHNPATGHTLTVHHLDGNKANCSRDNLVALCQRCHLHIQAKYYPGQLSFLPYPWAEERGLM